MRYIITIFILSLLTVILVAQTTTDNVLDPEVIFVEGLDAILQDADSSNPPRIDYEGRILLVFDPINLTMEEFPLPEYIDRIIGIDTFDNEMVLIMAQDISDENILVQFERSREVYNLPPTICAWNILQAEVGQGQWHVAYPDDEYANAILCNSETGEIRDILPNDHYFSQTAYSPDGRYMVLIGQLARGIGGYGMYSWQVGSDILINIGGVGIFDSSVVICGWFNNTQGMICNNSIHTYAGFIYFQFDVTQAYSSEQVIRAWNGTVERLEHPVRFVSLYSQAYRNDITGSRSEHLPCSVTIVDADGIFNQEIGYDCLTIGVTELNKSLFYRRGDWVYFLSIDEENPDYSRLSRFNIETKSDSSTIIYVAEIEGIVGVSPNNNYAVILLDDNNEIDFQFVSNSCCSDELNYRVAIVRIDTGEILYASEPMGTYAISQVVWINDETVLIQAQSSLISITHPESSEPILDYVPSTIRYITIQGSNVEVTIRNNRGLTSLFNDARDIEQNRYRLTDENILIDLCSLTYIPILQEDIPEDYTVWLYFAETNLMVSVRYENDYPIWLQYQIVLYEDDC